MTVPHLLSGLMPPILGFHNEHRFMSNFEPARVQLDGVWYPTTEHAYQAAKTLDLAERRTIQLAKTAGQAKKLGQLVTKRADWENVKEKVMYDLLVQKFALEPYKEQLLATGNAYLEETNTWGDTYWGVCKGQGKNRLGYLLMEVRQVLRTDKNAAALEKLKQDLREAEWAMGKATGADGGAYRP